MRIHFSFIAGFIAFSLILSGCGSFAKTQDEEQLMISLDSTKEVNEIDTHGGMGGDGYSVTVYSCEDDVLEQIQSNKKWAPLPMDDVTETLAYGKDGVGPYLCDDNQSAVLPEVENGYYILVDRRDLASQKDKEILDGRSFNFTIGIYDTDTNKLYVGKLDT